MKKKSQGTRYCLCLLAAVLGVSPAFSNGQFAVENLRLWPAPDHTRVVLDLSGPVQHNFFTLPGPRMVIDIENAVFLATLDGIDLRQTPIREIRTGFPQRNTLRVVLDLKEDVDTRFFALKKIDDMNDRLVLDLIYRGARAQTQVILEDPTTNGRRDIIIAIDPGHGGDHPGAVGSNKIYEKDIVLDISRRLAKIINDAPGYTAMTTRDGDYRVEYRQRRELARQQRADLFLSIHSDAFKHKSAHGASVYALNANGNLATSETARYLAERDNESDLIGGVGSVSIRGMEFEVASTLLDLSQTATLNSSLQAGQYILDSLGRVADLHKNQVEQADFAVLRSPDLPSLLIETGFISNPGEAKRLSTPAYRQKLAESIFAGVRAYFYDAPPSGTYVAWQKTNGGTFFNEHVIARGETLSTIAQRYKVTVNDIISANQLNNTTIRAGQRLKIPST